MSRFAHPIRRRQSPDFSRRRMIGDLALGGAGTFCAAALGLSGGLVRQAWAAASWPVWLEDFKDEARAKGISPGTIDRAFVGVKPLPRVIELDHRQPEVKLSFESYIAKIVSPERVEQGRNKFAENKDLLQEVGGRYQVDPAFIVALWGLETSYGALPGNYSIIASLATLAYDGRRGAFFRSELLAALRILDEGFFTVADLRGSWAGAMGQTQFMPSSYLKFAVDYSGNGRRDIWHDRADVFASIANYLRQSGWIAGQGWGMRVVPPPGFDPRYAMTLARYMTGVGDQPLETWRSLGIAGAAGDGLPDSASASLVQPGGPGGSCFLVTSNYRAILKWNRSLYFATAAGLLADQIAS